MRIPALKALFLSFFLAVVAGCSSNLASVEDMEPPIAADMIEAGLLDEYIIGIGDVLRVSVWRNAELSTEAVVLPDGTISIPLAGDVRAAGKSTVSLAAGIKDTLNNYIREPEVTVSVVSAESSIYLQRVRIAGAVNSPRSIPHRRGLTVLDLVLEAGGTTEFANANKAALYRKAGEELKVYPVRLKDIMERGKLETNYTLLPSDIIAVPERSF